MESLTVPGGWVTPEAAARMLMMSLQQILELVEAGRVNVVSTATGWFLSPDDLQQVAAERAAALAVAMGAGRGAEAPSSDAEEHTRRLAQLISQI